MVLVVDPEPDYRRVTFPLYGLPPSWDGPRWVGESAGGVNPDRFQLAHGQRWDGPNLRATSWRPDWYPYPEIGSSIAGMVGALDTNPPDGGGQTWQREIEQLSDALNWEVVPILVDEKEVMFRLITHDDDWGGYSLDKSVAVDMVARSFTRAIQLVRITDAMPYIEGTRAYWRSRGWNG